MVRSTLLHVAGEADRALLVAYPQEWLEAFGQCARIPEMGLVAGGALHLVPCERPDPIGEHTGATGRSWWQVEGRVLGGRGGDHRDRVIVGAIHADNEVRLPEGQHCSGAREGVPVVRER